MDDKNWAFSRIPCTTLAGSAPRIFKKLVRTSVKQTSLIAVPENQWIWWMNEFLCILVWTPSNAWIVTCLIFLLSALSHYESKIFNSVRGLFSPPFCQFRLRTASTVVQFTHHFYYCLEQFWWRVDLNIFNFEYFEIMCDRKSFGHQSKN